MLSKALVVGAYQRKLEEMAHQPGIEMIGVAPSSWRDRAYEMHFERSHTGGYQLITSPIAFNGNYHLFFFRRLGRLLDEHRPDILHFDEEPYNLATFLAITAARHRRIPALFFTWQNLARTYPAPFGWMERFVYRHAACAIAGTTSAEDVLRSKGYRGPVRVIPQFGVDPDLFSPAESLPRRFTIGFAGRLVPEKGVEVLVDACARLDVDFRLAIVGAGPAEAAIRSRVAVHGLQERVQLEGTIPSARMPQWLRKCDAVVLPSISQPNWIEQFGRILVEAMACSVPVAGSTCGEIPKVIGDAGLVFPEGNVTTLTAALSQLAGNPSLRADLGARGRRRVLEHFTHERIASATVDVYRSMLNAGGSGRAASV